MAEDRFGNPHAPGLPYAYGEHIRSSQDDHTKLRHAWQYIEQHASAGSLADIYNLSGLERGMDHADPLDDELAPALMGDRLNALALDHLGGNPETDAIMAFNRQTAAILTATLVLVQPGQSVIGVSATGSHACVVRAAKRAGANFVDTIGLADFEIVLKGTANVALVSLTRLAVSYEILGIREIARIGPAVFD